MQNDRSLAALLLIPHLHDLQRLLREASWQPDLKTLLLVNNLQLQQGFASLKASASLTLPKSVGYKSFIHELRQLLGATETAAIANLR